MNNIDEIKDLMSLLLKGLAEHFGTTNEFVLHDYGQGFDKSIVAIENPEVTNRSVGMGGTKIGLEVLQGNKQEEGNYNYLSQTPSGRMLRSTTIFINNEENETLGSFCVNTDITDMVNARNHINRIINLDDKEPKKLDTMVYPDVEDLLISMIVDSIDFVGTPVALMTRDQKIKGIEYLHQRGSLRITNANSTIAKYYDISIYTLYNYLNEANGKKD